MNTNRRTSKTGSHASLTHNRRTSTSHHGGVPVIPRDEAAVAMTLNSRLGPVAEASMLPRETYYAENMDAAFKYPHIQVSSFDSSSHRFC